MLTTRMLAAGAVAQATTGAAIAIPADRSNPAEPLEAECGPPIRIATI